MNNKFKIIIVFLAVFFIKCYKFKLIEDLDCNSFNLTQIYDDSVSERMDVKELFNYNKDTLLIYGLRRNLVSWLSPEIFYDFVSKNTARSVLNQPFSFNSNTNISSADIIFDENNNTLIYIGWSNLKTKLYQFDIFKNKNIDSLIVFDGQLYLNKIIKGPENIIFLGLTHQNLNKSLLFRVNLVTHKVDNIEISMNQFNVFNTNKSIFLVAPFVWPSTKILKLNKESLKIDSLKFNSAQVNSIAESENEIYIGGIGTIPSVGFGFHPYLAQFNKFGSLIKDTSYTEIDPRGATIIYLNYFTNSNGIFSIFRKSEESQFRKRNEIVNNNLSFIKLFTNYDWDCINCDLLSFIEDSDRCLIGLITVRTNQGSIQKSNLVRMSPYGLFQ